MAEPATQSPKIKKPVIFTVTSRYPLTEPFTGQRFSPNVPTETILTAWMQMQVEAGIAALS